MKKSKTITQTIYTTYCDGCGRLQKKNEYFHRCSICGDSAYCGKCSKSLFKINYVRTKLKDPDMFNCDIYDTLSSFAEDYVLCNKHDNARHSIVKDVDAIITKLNKISDDFITRQDKVYKEIGLIQKKIYKLIDQDIEKTNKKKS